MLRGLSLRRASEEAQTGDYLQPAVIGHDRPKGEHSNGNDFLRELHLFK